MARVPLSLVLTYVLATASCAGARSVPSATQPRQIFLVVVAHPDDENIIGGVLARLAREGNQVSLVIATDGKYGTRVTSVPEGEELGAIRRTESQCAAQALGIPSPTFFAVDRLDTKNGVRSYLEGRTKLLSLLADQLSTLRPDVILTFGPDGEYGHPEHIVVSAAITELLLRDGLVEKYPLYYFAWKPEQVLDDESLSSVDPRYLGVVARFSDEDEEKSFQAARCYATQFTQDEIDDLIKGASESDNVIFFRRFRADLFPSGSPLEQL